MKKVLTKVLVGATKIYNRFRIKDYYRSSAIQAEELRNLGKVLVLIPHVDDEVIGLGGVLAGLSEEYHIDLLYGTDSGASRSVRSREEISNIRFKEAENLAKELNLEIVEKMLDIHNEDKIWSFNVFANYLTEVLKEQKYDSIFTVSMVDAHPEHQRLTSFLGRYLKDSEYDGDIYLYEVSNLLPNTWINTYYPMSEEVWSKKQELYRHFGSQKTMDFEIFNILNKSKGLAVGEIRPVEYFTKMSREKFVGKVDKLVDENMGNVIPFRIGNNRSFYKVINREKDAQRLYKDKGW